MNMIILNMLLTVVSAVWVTAIVSWNTIVGNEFDVFVPICLSLSSSLGMLRNKPLATGVTSEYVHWGSTVIAPISHGAGTKRSHVKVMHIIRIRSALWMRRLRSSWTRSKMLWHLYLWLDRKAVLSHQLIHPNHKWNILIVIPRYLIRFSSCIHANYIKCLQYWWNGLAIHFWICYMHTVVQTYFR